MCKLKDYAYYVTDKISATELNSKKYISIDNMLVNKAGVTTSEYVPLEGNVTRFKVGDILLGNIRPYFKKIWLAGFNGGCSPDVLCIRSNGKVSAEFLYSLLSQDIFFDYDMAGAKGSKMPRGDKNHIMNFPVPNISSKEEIGKFIVSIDNKIQNNNKINTELEAMAKIIYDYWFLQFEFPNEEGKPYKSSGGKMVWNDELNQEIPEGWKVEQIEKYCNIFTGKKDVNQSFDKGKYKFFSCAPGYKYSNDKIFEGKAILISGNGSYTGRTILVNDSFDLYQRTYACTNKFNEDYMEYIYYSMLKFFVPKVSGGTHGSAIPYIVYNDIAKQKILINIKIIEKFEYIIKDIVKKSIILEKENEELTSLRDYLLPLLMNGQIGFKD